MKLGYYFGLSPADYNQITSAEVITYALERARATQDHNDFFLMLVHGSKAVRKNNSANKLTAEEALETIKKNQALKRQQNPNIKLHEYTLQELQELL